jgi:hypothetical protein
LKWLNVVECYYDEKANRDKVKFKRLIAVIPPAPEDATVETMEKFINSFVHRENKEFYTDFPYMSECFPYAFENRHMSYTVYGDAYTNSFKVHSEQMMESVERFDNRNFRIGIDLFKLGIDCGAFKTLVKVSKVTGVRYDSVQKLFYKVYDEDTTLVPFSLLVQRRPTSHFMNVSKRTMNLGQAFEAGEQVISLTPNLFGVMGICEKVD